MSFKKWARFLPLWLAAGLLILSFFVFLFPFFGWLAMGFLYFFRRPPREKISPEDNLGLAPIFEPGSQPGVSRKAARERVLKELDFLPLVEALSSNDIDLKRGAIERLAEVRTPEAIHTLLARRNDPDMEVRFYVTTALNRIKKEWDEELTAAKQEMQRDIYKISARIFLAKFYLQYAASGLTDPLIAKTYEGEAMVHLKYAVKSEFGRREAFELLLDIYSRREDWIAALGVIEQMEKKEKAPGEEIRVRKIDCLYRMGRYPDVAKEATLLKSFGELRPSLQTVIHWWSGA